MVNINENREIERSQADGERAEELREWWGVIKRHISQLGCPECSFAVRTIDAILLERAKVKQ